MKTYRHALNNQIVTDTKSFWEAEREERKLNDKVKTEKVERRKKNKYTNVSINTNSTNTSTNIILDKKQ